MGGLELGAKDSDSFPKAGVKRGVAVLDFILRLVAIIATLASAIAMGTTDESLPFFTQFIRFRAKYNDLPMFTQVFRSGEFYCKRLLSSFSSTVHLPHHKEWCTKQQGGLDILRRASAAAAIVYLAHKGNTRTNWFAICQQFNSFCERVSGSLIGSFGGMIVFILLILMSAATLARRR
ncbi:hypothetical protein Pfo_010224 [Paulownia fortunei]|nr:hypothetical protein Pfo_010224 [Paulownia fortunei]